MSENNKFQLRHIFKIFYRTKYYENEQPLKFVFSKNATKIDEIFTVNLIVCSKCQIEYIFFFHKDDITIRFRILLLHQMPAGAWLILSIEKFKSRLGCSLWKWAENLNFKTTIWIKFGLNLKKLTWDWICICIFFYQLYIIM